MISLFCMNNFYKLIIKLVPSAAKINLEKSSIFENCKVSTPELEYTIFLPSLVLNIIVFSPLPP